MKLTFTFPPPRLRRAIIPLKNPKNLSEQTEPPQAAAAMVTQLFAAEGSLVLEMSPQRQNANESESK
jgi:hypothetical protein